MRRQNPNVANTEIERGVAERFLVDIPEIIRQNLSKKNPLWLACSGGRDSMALLNACYQLGLPIHVIHINHQLQTPSDAWQALVSDFCQTHSLPFSAHKLNFPKPHRVNEQTARTARYHAMLAIIQAFYPQQSLAQTPVIALAHHANDQAETILMNLCQGTGITGLTGMTSWAEQREFGTPIWLWRPLLTVSREQISEYVVVQKIPFVDDPTNVGEHNQRAFLREQILPKLAERFGGLVHNMSRTSQNMAEIGQIMTEQLQVDWQACQLLHNIDTPLGEDFYQSSSANPLQHCLHMPTMQKLSQPRRLQLLRYWLKGNQKFAPNRQFILQVNALILHNNPDQQTLLYWQGVAIRRYRDTLYRLSPTYLDLLNNPSTSVKVNLSTNLHTAKIDFAPLPIQIRQVALGESFARLTPFSQTAFHESYKKLCQRFNVPSWERGLGRVVLWQHVPIALLLPNLSVWLVDACELAKQNDVFEAILAQPCMWYITPDVKH